MKSRTNLQLEQLKRNLVTIINEYIKSRSSYITVFFRNMDLTDERVSLAKTTIKELMTKTSHDDLIELIQQKRLDNADLSNKYFKKHDNHFGYVDIANRSSFDSDLANVFHKIIDEINGDKNIVTNNPTFK